MSRRNVLLLILAIECVYLGWTHWPEPGPGPEFDASRWTVGELIDGLDGGDGWRCAQELQRRGRRHGPDAIELALSHESAQVRASSMSFFSVDAETLGDWLHRGVNMLEVDRDRDVREMVAISMSLWIQDDLLANAPEQLLRQLRSMLRDERSLTRARACIATSFLGTAATPLLAELLQMDTADDDRTNSTKVFRLSTLGRLRSEAGRVVPELCQALRDPDEEVRTVAASALAELGATPRSAIDALAERWRDERESVAVRLAAFAALADLPLAPRDARRLANEALHAHLLFAPLEHDGVARWTASITDLALLSADDATRTGVIRSLLPVLRDESITRRDTLVAGAVARLAAARRDPSMLALTAPELLDEIFSQRDRYQIWSDIGGIRLSYEALVDVCLWQHDDVLTPLVRSTLLEVEAGTPGHDHRWSHTQLARLPQPR